MELSLFALTYLLNAFYITVLYHRGLAHGAVTLKPWARRLTVATGNWVTGLDPKGWACMHRLHHRHSDTELDPHSPRRAGVFGVMLEQLRSYELILRRLKKHDPELSAVIADLDFPVNWLNRKKLWFLPYVAHGAVAVIIAQWGWALGLAYWLGMMSHPLQGWLVNAFAHRYGYRNFTTADDSTNNSVIALLVFGEGYQNNHHARPQSPVFAVRWFEVDLGYALCWMAWAAGLIYFPGAKSHPKGRPEPELMHSLREASLKAGQR